MGYGGNCICYNNYCENGEISSRQLVDSLLVYRNYLSNSNFTNRYRNYAIYLQESSSEHNMSSIDINNEDNSFRLDSIILENVDKLCSEKKKCTVCLEDFENSDKVINLTCLHMFHSECIRKWLRKNNSCPICKNEVDLLL